MNGYYGDVFRAAGFLSRIPMPGYYFDDGAFDLRRTVRAFPLAGLLISLPAAIVLILLLMIGTPTLFAALGALTVQILVTGALHEDGLADTADGFWGGRDKAHTLEIMHDSRMGAYGVIALVLSIGLRASALSAIAQEAAAISAALLLLAAETLSRTAIVIHWSLTSPARSDGVAATAGQPEMSAVGVAAFSGVIITFILCFPVTGQFITLLLVLAAYAAAYGFTGLTKGKIGGHTGDTLGACQQVTIIAVLFVATLIL